MYKSQLETNEHEMPNNRRAQLRANAKKRSYEIANYNMIVEMMQALFPQRNSQDIALEATRLSSMIDVANRWFVVTKIGGVRFSSLDQQEAVEWTRTATLDRRVKIFMRIGENFFRYSPSTKQNVDSSEIYHLGKYSPLLQEEWSRHLQTWFSTTLAEMQEARAMNDRGLPTPEQLESYAKACAWLLDHTGHYPVDGKRVRAERQIMETIERICREADLDILYSPSTGCVDIQRSSKNWGATHT